MRKLTLAIALPALSIAACVAVSGDALGSALKEDVRVRLAESTMALPGDTPYAPGAGAIRREIPEASRGGGLKILSRFSTQSNESWSCIDKLPTF